jgi:uncharacterized membrane protein YqjE
MSQRITTTGEVDLVGQEQSLGKLFGTMTTDLSRLFQQEVELAKVELKEEASKASKAVAMFGAAGVAAHMALLFVSLAAAWLLDEWMPESLAYLLVGGVYGIAAAVLAKVGQERMKDVRPVPEQTIETVKEDVQWARAQRS